MNKRWKIIVELTFDREPDDEALEAFQKVRPNLDELIGEGKFAHYHIVRLPTPCIELD